MYNELPICDILPVQLSTLMASIEEDIVLHKKKIKSNVINAAIEELRSGITLCNVPSKDELEAASLNQPLNWNAIASLEKI